MTNYECLRLGMGSCRITTLALLGEVSLQVTSHISFPLFSVTLGSRIRCGFVLVWVWSLLSRVFWLLVCITSVAVVRRVSRQVWSRSRGSVVMVPIKSFTSVCVRIIVKAQFVTLSSFRKTHLFDVDSVF